MKRIALMPTTLGVLVASAGILLPTLDASAQTRSASAQSQPTYWAYVANESSDIVSLVRFDGTEVVEEKAIDVGPHPADIDGAHGIAVSPNGTHWYVSIAHGQPYGQIWQMETGTDQFVDSALVGLFPATMSMTPDGSSLFVVNFNLHGDHVPSSVSAVFTPIMSEITQIETCVMPHGSRVSSDGLRHYSTCMMSDQLVESSVMGMDVQRMTPLTDMGTSGVCKPTWVLLSPDDTRIYVPCNGRGDVLEIDAESMEVLRRFPAGSGPYNADITPDGRTLVVSLKGEQAAAIFDLETGEKTRVATSQPVTHGVAITPDGRFAFVTNESRGATRGTIDVIDITAREVVASTPLHYQPGGLAVWKMEGGQ
jgi:DNA-binding beta-propeller fold protein YncE